MEAVIECRDEDTGVVFRWHGGAYIDVGYVDDIEGGGFVAGDVINIWDDEADQSAFENDAEDNWQGRRYVGRHFRFILEAFEARCEQYLKEASEES